MHADDVLVTKTPAPPFSNVPLSPLPGPVWLAHAGLCFGARRRVNIFPMSAGKYSSEEIKTSVRLCESILSALSLLRPLLFPSRFLPTRAVRLHVWSFAFGCGGGYMIIVQSGRHPTLTVDTAPPSCSYYCAGGRLGIFPASTGNIYQKR